MVEVGGSNPPGPTKIKNPPLGGFFGFGGVGLDEGRCATNATKGALGPPKQSGGARRVQSPEAMAIEDNPPGPTKFLNPYFYPIVNSDLMCGGDPAATENANDA